MAQVCMQRGDMKQAAEWCGGPAVEQNSLSMHLVLGRAKALAGDSTGPANLRTLRLNRPDDSTVRAELGNLYLRKYDYGAR